MNNPLPTTGSGPPLVSIVIPAYNRACFLGATLDSVQEQTYQTWECIVVDDGSTDNTREVVAEYAGRDSRIKYLYQRNRGPAAARNQGLRSCQGQYVQFWDSDDLVEARKLELHVSYLEQHPEIDMVYSGVRYFQTEKPEERRHSMWENDAPWMPEVSGSGIDVLRFLISDNIMVMSAPLLRKSVVEVVGYFDNSLNPLEDWDYWIRCLASGKRIQYLDLDQTFSLVRSHPASLNKDRESVMHAGLLLRKKIERSFTDPEVLKINRKVLESLEQSERDGRIREALAQVKAGRRAHAMSSLIGIASAGRNYREMIKWIFCALMVPFVPENDFEGIVTAPVRESLLKILRLRRDV
jgi:glycosyltransferase involved in cell wall biosynthesis